MAELNTQSIQESIATPDSLFKRMMQSAIGVAVNEQECFKAMYQYWIRLAIQEDWAAAFCAKRLSEHTSPMIIMPDLLNDVPLDKLKSMSKSVVNYKIIHDLHNGLLQRIADIDLQIRAKTVKLDLAVDQIIDKLLQHDMEHPVLSKAKSPVPKPKPEHVSDLKKIMHTKLAEIAHKHAKVTYGKHALTDTPDVTDNTADLKRKVESFNRAVPRPKKPGLFKREVLPELHNHLLECPQLINIQPSLHGRQQFLQTYLFHPTQPTFGLCRDVFWLHHDRSYLDFQAQVALSCMQDALAVETMPTSSYSNMFGA